MNIPRRSDGSFVKFLDGRKFPLWQRVLADPYTLPSRNMDAMTNDQLLNHFIRSHDAINFAGKRSSEEANPAVREAFAINRRVRQAEFRVVYAKVRERMTTPADGDGPRTEGEKTE